MYSQIRFQADDLIYYHPKLTTEIFDRNGRKVANLFDGEHRYYVPFDEIPVPIIEALIAIEDTMFFEHHGVNYEAIFRAMLKNLIAMRYVEGASTLTQQLVKNKLLTREKKLSRKIKEFLLALKVESALTKEEILERYLNEVYFGHGYYGIKTAAKGYFHKELYELTAKEIAILVGLPKAPSAYAPTRNYELALGRANRVLKRLGELGWIDERRLSAALEAKPEVFDDTLTQNLAPYAVDEIKKELLPYYPDLKTGGYTVVSTIDLDYQARARDAMVYAYEKALERAGREVTDEEEMERGVNPQHAMAQLNGALVSIEPQTGDIIALIGGVNYQKSSFNRAIQSKRQPGSAFKPFLYQIALDSGFSPSTMLADIARTYEYEIDGEQKKWKPQNYGKNFKGLISLKEALVYSKNLATINLVTDVGLMKMHNKLEDFGFKDLPKDLSISLGAIGMSPLELSEYYTIFSNYGTRVKPKIIKSIQNSGGQREVIETQAQQVTTPQQAYLMNDIMRSAVNRGTGRRARVKGMEIAGKTGTTNNSVDGWFCGYSPSLQTIVWFGNDDNTPLRKGETGGKISGPAFRKYYELVLEIHPELPRKFPVPEGVYEARINGKTEYFTDISTPPVTEQKHHLENSLIF
jgi:penicillin-binding protein 1A